MSAEFGSAHAIVCGNCEQTMAISRWARHATTARHKANVRKGPKVPLDYLCCGGQNVHLMTCERAQP